MTQTIWSLACDCHVHVYEQGYPLVSTATFKPPHAPASEYLKVQNQLGFGRVIVVQPTGYGLDNRCTLDAIAQLGSGARGIAVIRPETSEEELHRLHHAGIRGVRYMMLPGGVLPWDGLEETAAKIASFGWNINLQLDGSTLQMYEKRLLKLPCHLVIDHIGKFLTHIDLQSHAFLSLCSILDGGRCWIKLSAPYESSLSGPPDYKDIAPRVNALAAMYPQRSLWASNWPHPNVVPTPSDQALLDWAMSLFGNEATTQRILVDNPAELYGFVSGN
mgnify:CR=1 FL=1